jgi:hypothetical protein
MYYLRYAVIAFSVIIVNVAGASTGHAEWELLGKKRVGFETDRDVVHVGRREGRFDRLKLKVSRNGIKIRKLRVIYGNGERDRLHIRRYIRAGEETRPLELRGRHGRRIDRIEMVYRSGRRGERRAVVRIFGDSVRSHDRRDDHYGRDEGYGRDHRDGHRRDDREGDRYRDERRGERHSERGEERHEHRWKLLGREKVNRFGDRDSIRVGRSEGRFRKIKLRVLGNDISFRVLKIVYGNGEVDDIQVRRKVREGSETRAIDLPGRSRVIRKIVMKYSRELNFRGKAVVEVWGLRAH